MTQVDNFRPIGPLNQTLSQGDYLISRFFGEPKGTLLIHSRLKKPTIGFPNRLHSCTKILQSTALFRALEPPFGVVPIDN
jgi:hypothetical protein